MFDPAAQHLTVKLTLRERDVHRVSDRDVGGPAHDVGAIRDPADGIATSQHGERTHRVEAAGGAPQTRVSPVVGAFNGGSQAALSGQEPETHLGQSPSDLEPVQPTRECRQATVADGQAGPECAGEAVSELGRVSTPQRDPPGDTGEGRTGAQPVDAAARVVNTCTNTREQTSREAVDARSELIFS